jgi:hypothetical protein
MTARIIEVVPEGSEPSESGVFVEAEGSARHVSSMADLLDAAGDLDGAWDHVELRSGDVGPSPEPSAARTSGSSIAFAAEKTAIPQRGYMTTTGKLLWRADGTGRVEALTRTWCVMKLVGYVGAVGVLLLDSDGHAIHACEVRSFGVDGQWIGRSDRTDFWTEGIPRAVMDRVEGVYVFHSPNPRGLLVNLRMFVEQLEPITSVLSKMRGLADGTGSR